MIAPSQLKQLLQDIESDRIEMTESVSDTDKFCRAICAYANDFPDYRLPGYLLVAVDKKGRPTGTPITDRILQNLASHRDNGEIIPQPVMNVQKLDIDGVAVAVVEVFPSTLLPVRYKGVTHIRVGPRRAIATVDEERRLSERSIDRARTWDARACTEASIDDLSVDLFTLSYLPNAVAREVLEENERSAREQLAALRFYDLRSDHPTHAAMLLFGKDPVSFFPGAYVQYVRYDGCSQGDDVLSDQRMSSDLLGVMRELDQLSHRVSEQRPLRQSDLRDATVYTYPPIALHELFINAVVHRNYEASTTPIMINQFADRLEIHNPGSLYGELTREHFPSGTAYRNPILAEAARTLGFVNRFGRGIAKAQSEMQSNGSRPIDFDIGENHFAAIVRGRV